MEAKRSVSAQQFWNTFIEVVGKAIADGPGWKLAWRRGGGPWSDWIFPLLKQVYAQLGYGPSQVEQEKHGRIDFTLVAAQDGSSPRGIEDLDVDIAIEHENNPSQWDYEWKKLQRFKRANLRVVVGYSKPGRLLGDIEKANEIMRTAADRDDRPMLLIVGPVDGKTGEEFRAWEWKDEAFQQLPNRIALSDTPEPDLGLS